MALITKPYTFTAGATIVASEHNSNFDTIINDYNGNITNANISASAAISATKLSLGTIAQAMTVSAAITMSGAAINFAKGSDIASASTTDIGAATGNFVDVTGTTTITALGTVQAGTMRIVRFTGALLLTHNATSLILPTGANITTAAGDAAIFESLGSGNWVCLFFQRKDGTPLTAATAANALSGSVVQVVNYQTGAVATGSTAMPYDDTIPQITEGDQYMSLAITPNSASNKLKIDVVFYGASAGSGPLTVALFQDSTADALAAVGNDLYTTNVTTLYSFTYYMTAGTTSATTFKVRAGNNTSATATFNGLSSARKYGGVAASSITITEIKV